MSESEEPKKEFHLIDEKPTSESDWDIGELYGKARDIVKNNKITWIFGAAVASLASSSYRSNSSSSSNDSNSSETIQNLFKSLPSDQHQAGEKISMVLGEAITPLQKFLNELWQIIPGWVYIVIGLEVVFLIIMAMIIQSVYGAWAKASLIESVQAGYLKQKMTIRSVAEASFKHIKSIFLLSLIPLLAFLIIIPLSILLFVIMFLIGNTLLKVFAGILIVVEIVGLIYLMLLFNIALIWAFRQVVISNMGTKEAFKKGMQMARKKFWASLLLGGVNTILGSILMIIPWVFVGIFAVGTVFAFIFKSDFSYPLLSIAVVIFIAALVISTIMGAIIEAFKAATWTVAYDKIKGKYDN